MNSPVRKFKNTLIKSYFDFRINGVESPNQIRFRKTPYKFIFILGHMRSASSLLVHILNAHPDIIGYGETHITYHSSQDFKTLLSKVHWMIRDYKMEQKYVLDKLLHDEKLKDESILNSPDVSGIFLLRTPVETLSSILGIKPHWSEEQTVDYYINRLKTLEKYGSMINDKSRSLVLTHDQIITETDLVFKALQALLQTQEPFSEEYSVLPTTGFKGIGDSSDNIKSGRILREKKAKPPKHPFPAELIDKAQYCYEHCLNHLSEVCSTIDSEE